VPFSPRVLCFGLHPQQRSKLRLLPKKKIRSSDLGRSPTRARQGKATMLGLAQAALTSFLHGGGAP
jgi:hypothetical protein